jgi:hypothetical protein
MPGFNGDDKDSLIYQQTQEWEEGAQDFDDGVWAELDLSGVALASIKELHLICVGGNMVISRVDTPASGGFPVEEGVLHVLPLNAPNHKVFIAGAGADVSVHWEVFGFTAAEVESKRFVPGT